MKKAKKNLRQRSTKHRPVTSQVRRYVGRYTDNAGNWNKNWNAERVAKKFGLTKYQVAAVKAWHTMGGSSLY